MFDGGIICRKAKCTRANSPNHFGGVGRRCRSLDRQVGKVDHNAFIVGTLGNIDFSYRDVLYNFHSLVDGLFRTCSVGSGRTFSGIVFRAIGRGIYINRCEFIAISGKG